VQAAPNPAEGGGGGGHGGEVVNVQTKLGGAIARPDVSCTPVVIVAVKVAFDASVAEGVKVAILVATL